MSKHQNFRILHTQVGPWPKGFVVTPEQLAEHNADPTRLLNLKAIEPVEESGTGETPLVPDEIARQQKIEAEKNAAAKKQGDEPTPLTPANTPAQRPQAQQPPAQQRK